MPARVRDMQEGRTAKEENNLGHVESCCARCRAASDRIKQHKGIRHNLRVIQEDPRVVLRAGSLASHAGDPPWLECAADHLGSQQSTRHGDGRTTHDVRDLRKACPSDSTVYVLHCSMPQQDTWLAATALTESIRSCLSRCCQKPVSACAL